MTSMRRALGSTSGGSLPTPSPMSSSAPDSDRLGAVYASNFAHQQQHPPHQPFSRSASAIPAAGRADDRAGPRSRSALGLSTRPHASRSVAGPGDHTYRPQPHRQHPPRDPHSRSGHSYSGHSDHSDAATASSSPSTSALSVRADDTLAASAVELSPERRQMLIDFVDRSVDDAYNLCHGFGSVRWLPAKTREGVSIYRAKGGELSDDPRLDASVRGKCNVSASFDEMMDTMVTETTSDFVAHESSVNPAEFLDGQVLCTLVPRSRSDRFVCVKWHTIKSLAPSVAKHRDYVYVEVVDHFTDRDGRKVGFRLSKSVELEELEAFDHSEIFVRGKTLTLHTFSQVSPGNIELYTMMINDLGERLPAWLVHKIVDTAAMRSACLRDYINQKRMDLLVLARPKEMVPLHKRVCCVVCTRSFSLVRKKYNCVACGDVICNQCSVHQFVAPPSGTISDFVGKKKARICVQCSSSAKRRELPRRASSARASMLQAQQSPQPHHDAHLSEMDHRRVSGSTIGSKLQKQQSQYAQHLNRVMRSASSVEASNSASSMHEEQGRVHPTDSNGNNRSTIPHMFQFRPAKNNSSVLSAGRSSIRSSGMSTARSSSSPDDDTILHAAEAVDAGNDDDDELSDDDDDQEYMIPGDAELEANGAAAAAAAAAVNGGDMDFDNLLDATALDSSNGANGSVDLGVGKYRASYANAGTLSTDVSEDELTDADDEDTLTTPSTGSSGSAVSAALSPPPASTPLGDTEDDDGLIIQEVSPQNSFRQSVASSKGMTPRQSIVSMTSADDEVTIVKPMVVKQVRKRPAPGASARVIKSDIEITEVEPSRSPNAPELPPPRANPMVETIVVQSRRATITEEPVFEDNNADGVYNEANQLADLQVHLDRMTMIAESLKNLNQPDESPSKKMRPSTVSPAELQAQYAKISNIEMRAQEEAALAAGFAQAILDEAQANAAAASERMTSSAMHLAEEMELSDDDYGEDEEIELMDLSLGADVHLTREDGSFSGFLADSSFMDMASASPEGAAVVPGWVAVHSKTTGKVYFYNESVGTTSWTVPTPDTTRRSGSYMVL